MRLRLLLGLLTIIAMHPALSQAPGQLTDTVRCKRAPAFTYALYVPKSFSNPQQAHVIIFIEPAARGKLPVETYHELADRYNIILACSNQARNGPMPEILAATYAVFDDLAERFELNKSKIWLSGFSGGARAATSMALDDKRFEGVLACGAAFPVGEKITTRRKIPFAEMVGTIDMNYREGEDAHEYLINIGNPATFITFYGGHDWPPPEIYEEAIRWHLRESLSVEEKHRWYTNRFHQVIAQLDSNAWHTAHRMARQLQSDFSNEQADSLLAAIERDPKWKKGEKEEERLRKLENDWQIRFFDKYNRVMRTSSDTSIHAGEWSSFAKEIGRLQTSKDTDRKNVGLRLHDLSWRYCAEQGLNYFSTNSLKRAELSFILWTYLDDERPYAYVNLARTLAKGGDKKGALVNLEKAIDKGFHNTAFLQNDDALKPLQMDAAFIALINKIK